MPSRHPLADEDVDVIVTLRHVPTRAEATACANAPADEGMTLTEAVDKAFGAAANELLDNLEQRGGG